ncbi:hypothetical protein HID58_034914 [Brassica napus]|uniref:Uncharacterized protein n=1 Tax=Brassica napus TaxID=3708 RepID=A0ABQ8C3K5_BRANA|nr:hypothetical protein HID58_034914 [Brassica napus]
MGTAASQIRLFAAWTRVAILAVEGIRVARFSRHHRFSSSPEIPPSDHPSQTGTPSFRAEIRRRKAVGTLTPRRLEPMTAELTKLPRHGDKRPAATDL